MRNPQDISVAIADDHPWVTGGIKTTIVDYTNYKVVATATDGKQLLHVLNSHFGDLILLDLNLPELSGLDAAEIIKQRFPNVKIIVITTYQDSKIINTLKKIGVEDTCQSHRALPNCFNVDTR